MLPEGDDALAEPWVRVLQVMVEHGGMMRVESGWDRLIVGPVEPTRETGIMCRKKTLQHLVRVGFITRVHENRHRVTEAGRRAVAAASGKRGHGW